MTKAIIDVVFRSMDEIEIASGVFDFKYTLIRRVPCDVVNIRHSNSDSSTLNLNNELSISFSAIIPGLAGHRDKTLSYIVYNGIVYDVLTYEFYPPRVRITPGGRFKGTLDDLRIEDRYDR